MEPLVSVVIPTCRRPNLVQRAVRSALAQTLERIEVIVVIDGPDESTCIALREIDDKRLKVIELPSNQGCYAARNAGVAAANAKWIAHLDDDDEWIAEKLELQIAVAELSQHKYPVVSCYVIARTSEADNIFPRRLPNKSEPISEYLFVRNTLFQGEGLIQSSTIFTLRELLLQVPLKEKHDDWGWLLQVSNIEGVGIEFVSEVLSIWHLEKARHSLSRVRKWRSSFDWIREKKKQSLVTPRAYSSFILAEVSARAARDGDYQAFFTLLIEAIRFGKPQFLDICLYLGMWILSPDMRNFLRGILSGKRQIIYN